MIIIYIFSFYLFLYLTNLFIDFLKTTTFTHARLFCLYCCYFTKKKNVNIVLFILIWVQNPVITTTVTKSKANKKKKEMDRNPRIAIQRLYLLNPWSHFLPFSERSTKEFDPIWWKREMQSFRVRIYEFMFKVLSSVKIWVVNELNGPEINKRLL